MKLIKKDNDFYIISDEEIKGVGYRMDMKRMTVGVIDDDNYYNRYPDDFKKIIASTEILKLPLINEVDIERIIGEKINIDRLADESMEEWERMSEAKLTNKEEYAFGFLNGYDQSLLDNIDKVFTLKDMEECWHKGAKFVVTAHQEISSKQAIIDFTNSIIKKPTEWDIELEMDLDIQAPKSYPQKYPSVNEVPKITNGFVKILLK